MRNLRHGIRATGGRNSSPPSTISARHLGQRAATTLGHRDVLNLAMQYAPYLRVASGFRQSRLSCSSGSNDLRRRSAPDPGPVFGTRRKNDGMIID